MLTHLLYVLLFSTVVYKTRFPKPGRSRHPSPLNMAASQVFGKVIEEIQALSAPTLKGLVTAARSFNDLSLG